MYVYRHVVIHKHKYVRRYVHSYVQNEGTKYISIIIVDLSDHANLLSLLDKS